MQQPLIKNVRKVSPVLAGVMVAIMLVIGFYSASATLHLGLHQDSHPHSVCAVCLIAQGQLGLAVVTAAVALLGGSVMWVVPELASASARSLDFSVSSTRGPPFCPASR